jgi:hypothetical protein
MFGKFLRSVIGVSGELKGKWHFDHTKEISVLEARRMRVGKAIHLPAPAAV